MSAIQPSRILHLFLILVVIIFAIGQAVYAQSFPTAPDNMQNMSSQSPSAAPGYALTTNGGTITVVNINATSQNPHWKAYVGNITGKLALNDANSNSVYDWNITSMEGEVYATRNTGIVNWNSITCASLGNMQSEETALNMTSSMEDSIANTFSKKEHAAFYAGLTPVVADSCNSTNLYVNSELSGDFAEVMLYDGSYAVYAALIEDSITGFDGNKYDFQMILPDSGLEGSQSPSTYYFYVELI